MQPHCLLVAIVVIMLVAVPSLQAQLILPSLNSARAKSYDNLAEERSAAVIFNYLVSIHPSREVRANLVSWVQQRKIVVAVAKDDMGPPDISTYLHKLEDGREVPAIMVNPRYMNSMDGRTMDENIQRKALKIYGAYQNVVSHLAGTFLIQGPPSTADPAAVQRFYEYIWHREYRVIKSQWELAKRAHITSQMPLAIRMAPEGAEDEAVLSAYCGGLEILVEPEAQVMKSTFRKLCRAERAKFRRLSA